MSARLKLTCDRMVGHFAPLQLCWRSHAFLLDVCRLRDAKPHSVDLRHFHDVHSRSSLLQRRGALPHQVWRAVDQVLQHCTLEAHSGNLVKGRGWLGEGGEVASGEVGCRLWV